MIKALLLLIWPLNCAGCGEYDVILCNTCKEALKELTEPRSLEKNGLSVFCASKYTAQMRKMVLDWKDHGREDLDYFMQRLIYGATLRLLENSELPGRTRVAIIPAPSSKKSIKKRGKLQTLSLALGVQKALKDAGYRTQISKILKQKQAQKQVNFNAEARAQNKQNVIYLSVSVWRKVFKTKAPSQKCIIVDDISTTGTTLKNCQTVLENAGHSVIGLLALSSTGNSEAELKN